MRFDRCLKCNISFEKLKPLLKDFYHNIDEPVFVAIHVPLSRKEEGEMKQDGRSILHEEVLYMGEAKKEQVDKILYDYGDIILNDGMSKFAVASIPSKDEIFIEKYKITYLYGRDLDKHTELMKKYSIRETESLVTAWDTFSPEHPGRCSRIDINGIDIYYVVNELKKLGMYRAKVIETGKGSFMPA